MPDLIFAGVQDFNTDGVFDRVHVTGDAASGFHATLELMNADGTVQGRQIPAEVYFSTDLNGALQVVSVYRKPAQDESDGPDSLPRGGRVTVPFNGPGDGADGCNPDKIVLWRGSLDGWSQPEIKDKWTLLDCAGDAPHATPEVGQVQDGTAKTVNFRSKP